MVNMTEPLIVDFPEFGRLADWEQCLAELTALDQSDEVELAKLRCQEEIAQLKGEEPPAARQRMEYEEGSFVRVK